MSEPEAYAQELGVLHGGPLDGVLGVRDGHDLLVLVQLAEGCGAVHALVKDDPQGPHVRGPPHLATRGGRGVLMGREGVAHNEELNGVTARNFQT